MKASSALLAWAACVAMIGTDARADRTEFEKGLAAYRDGEYAMARPLLKRALSTLTATADRAVAHAHLGWIAYADNRRGDAARRFERAAHIAPGFVPVDEHTAPEPKAWYVGIRESWRGSLVIPVAGAVTVDDRPAVPSPCVLAIGVGVHRVRVRSPDGTKEFVAAALVVRPREKVTPRIVWSPRVGMLALAATPVGTTALVRGRAVARLPTRLSLPAGRHKVEFQAQGHAPESRWASVHPDAPATLAVSLKPLPASYSELPWYRRRRPWGVTALSVGAGSALAGLIAGLSARSAEDTLRAEERAGGMSTTRFNQLAGDATSRARWANGLFIVAGAMALTSVVLFAVGEATPSAPLRVSLGVMGAGLGIQIQHR